jgi:hypothetical protein
VSALPWRARGFGPQAWSGLASAAALVFESMLFALWYHALLAPDGARLADIFAALLLVMAASFLLLRLLHRFALRAAARQLIFLGWLLAAAFLSLKLLIHPGESLSLAALLGLPLRYITRADVSGDSFYHLFWVFVLAWRGVALARSPVTLSGVQTSFQLGLLLVLFYGMIFAPVYPLEATFGLYAYLFFGLFAMSMARIAGISELRGGRIPRFGPGWVLSVAAATLGVVALALLFGWLSSGRLVAILAQVLVVIFAIMTALVLLILSPLLLYLARIMPLLADFISQLLARFRNLPIAQQMEQLIDQMNDTLARIVPYALAARGLLLLGLLVVVILGVLLALYLRRPLHAGEEEAESEHAEGAGNDPLLRRLWNRLLGDARRLRRRSPAQLLAAARIRRIYRQLMALTAELGAGRPPSATPLEFLPELQALFPGQQDSLETITAAYLQVRYGAYPETAEEVAEVEAAWERVRRQGRAAAGALRATRRAARRAARRQ